jgi:hypothetical protein
MEAGAHFVHGSFGFGEIALVNFTIAADGINEVVGLDEAFDIGHGSLSFGRDEAGMAKFLILAGKQNIANREQDDQQE